MPNNAEPTALQLLIYGLPALPLAVLTLPFYILVPSFYARDLGLSLATVGSALLIVRIVDAASDPLIGILADKWQPAYGRRRVWFGLASLPAVLAAYYVFMPPMRVGVGYLVGWGIVLSVAWTAVIVPYTAWGAEISSSYSGRARVVAWRESFGVIGTLIALSAQAFVPLAGFPGQRNILAAMAIFVGIAVPLSVGGAVTLLPEPRDVSSRNLGLREGFNALLANRPFLRLLAAFFLNGCANGFPATLFLFFVTDRLKAGAAAGPLLLVYFLSGILGVPFWLWLARATSKHHAWAIGMGLACVCFAPAPFLAEGQTLAFGLVCVGTGLALGADIVLAPAIQADVIDVETAHTGSQRAGLYFALWGFATKLALAAAVGIAFPLLSLAGFDPSLSHATEFGLLILAILYAVVPIVLKLAAIGLVWNFPINATILAELRQRIDSNRQAAIVT